jgi:ADP-dependent NAD(P)H-hydrate dehydratase / NAD(P)H-hydrate epimerase
MRRLPPGAPILTTQAMRAAEAEAIEGGTTALALMERAAEAVATQAARFAMGRPVLVLAGPGNNGGDAWGAAALLRARGVDVMVAEAGEPRGAEAAAMRARYAGPVVPLDRAEARTVLVDGLFGIGLTRPIEGATAAAIERLGADADFVLAIDMPSGLDSESGAAPGTAVRANATLALGALKPAHVSGPDSGRCGHVLYDAIGIAASREARVVERPPVAPPGNEAHKYRRGLVLVVAGAMPGAARLAAAGAAHGGAGYVVLASDDARVPADAVVQVPPGEATRWRDDARLGAAVVGPGLGRDALEPCEQWAASDCNIVFDGDALSLLSVDALRSRRAATILTPHDGEFVRLFGSADGNRIEATRTAARDSGCVVVRKGADTIVAAPDGRVGVVLPPSWLSTAGTGDVLAGAIAARWAAIGDAFEAACQGVWLHARAARLAGAAFVADELAPWLSRAIGECRTTPRG